MARAAMHEDVGALSLSQHVYTLGVTQQGWQQLLWGIGAVVGASNRIKRYSCGIDVWLLHEDKVELCDRTSRTLRSGKTLAPAYKATHRGYP